MTNRVRGFEIISKYQNQGINLPKRSTIHAAGYDIEAAETIVVPSMIKQLYLFFYEKINQAINIEKIQEPSLIQTNGMFQSTLVPTGLKAYMQENEYLQIINRSSNPIKRFLALPNSIGIIDQDYYNNSENEGHIFVQLINYGLKDYTIQKGDRIAQGIFTQFLKVDADQGGEQIRTGGFGSTDES